MLQVNENRRRILKLIKEHGEASGGDLLKMDQDLPQNSLYVILSRMEKNGWLTSYVEKIPGERNRPRRFYKLTPLGDAAYEFARQELSANEKSLAISEVPPLPKSVDPNFDIIPFPGYENYLSFSSKQMDYRRNFLQQMPFKQRRPWAELMSNTSRIEDGINCPELHYEILFAFRRCTDPEYFRLPLLELGKRLNILINEIEAGVGVHSKSMEGLDNREQFTLSLLHLLIGFDVEKLFEWRFDQSKEPATSEKPSEPKSKAS